MRSDTNPQWHNSNFAYHDKSRFSTDKPTLSSHSRHWSDRGILKPRAVEQPIRSRPRQAAGPDSFEVLAAPAWEPHDELLVMQ